MKSNHEKPSFKVATAAILMKPSQFHKMALYGFIDSFIACCGAANGFYAKCWQLSVSNRIIPLNFQGLHDPVGYYVVAASV